MLGNAPSPVNKANSLVMLQDPDGNFIELVGPVR